MRNFATLVVALVAIVCFGFSNADAEINEVGSLDIEMNYFGDVATVRLTAFCTSGNGGLYTVDVSEPAQPRLLERYRGYCSSVEAMGDYAFVGFNGEEGLRVFFIDSLIYIGEPANVRGLLLNERLLYLMVERDSSSILQILDITEPTEPSLVGQLEVGHRGQPSVLIGGRLYIEGSDDGEVSTISVINVADPAEPEMVSQYDNHQGNIVGIATNGEYLFVANQEGGAEGIQVRDFDWELISETWVYMPQGLSFHDGYLYVVSSVIDDEPTFRIFDVSDPEELRVLEEYSTGRQAMDLWFADRLCYVVECGVDDEHPSRLVILRVEIAEASLTYFSVYGNEYDGQREHLGHESGETIGLWCRLNCPQPVSAIQFDLSVRSYGGVVLDVDSITIDEGIAGSVEASFRHNRILVFSPNGRAMDLENRHFVTAWVTLPENAHSIFLVVPENVILSNPDAEEIQVDEIHDGWFLAGPLGDLTLDGSLDVRDLVRLVNLVLAGGVIWEDRVGDLNQDGTVDAEDVALLIDAILDGAGRDSPGLEPAEVWQGNLDNVWQYQLSNQNPVRVFQLSLRGDLENVQPYLTERSAGMSLAYRYFPESQTMKIVVYSLGNTIEPGQGPVLIVPGMVEEVIFEKVVQVDPEGVPSRPFEGKPTGFLLDPAYPNPFNSTTLIGFALPQAGRATMAVYDLSGREAVRLINDSVPAGAQSVIFDAAGLATGTYLLRLESQQGVRTQKLMFVK